jgi:hypothetical protein
MTNHSNTNDVSCNASELLMSDGTTLLEFLTATSFNGDADSERKQGFDECRRMLLAEIGDQLRTARSIAQDGSAPETRSNLLHPVFCAAPTGNVKQDASPVAALSDADWKAFHRFCECADDSDSGGYDVSKEKMARLAELGVVQFKHFGRYQVTAFGSYLRGIAENEAQPLPLKTYAEYDREFYEQMHKSARCG